MKENKRYLNCRYLDAGMDGMLCSRSLCTTCKEFNGEKCDYYTSKVKDKEKYLDNSWRAKMVENGIYKDSETTSEEMIEEMAKLDIEESAGFYSAFINDMRISKNKPLSTSKTIMSFNCPKNYILQAIGISEDSVVYQDGKIYYNGEHIGYIEFSFYEDIKALGFGNFKIIDKRKGYGTIVIKDIIHKYKNKYNLIYCFVDKDNIGAIEFYKKVGKVCFDITNDKGQYQVILYGKEDSVVLSMEELKELAQKIYDDIFAILKIKLWLYGDDAMTKNLNGLTKQKILDFTKKWGIEDNHLNEKDYSHIDHLQAHDKQIKKQERKETAEKFARDIFNHITTPEVWERLRQQWLSIDGNFVANKHIYDLLIEPIAKQFRVEIKE